MRREISGEGIDAVFKFTVSDLGTEAGLIKREAVYVLPKGVISQKTSRWIILYNKYEHVKFSRFYRGASRSKV